MVTRNANRIMRLKSYEHTVNNPTSNWYLNHANEALLMKHKVQTNAVHQ